MTVTLSTDHRASMARSGAELLGAFKRYIENPMGMLQWLSGMVSSRVGTRDFGQL
jgi:hypothetical protein